MGVEEMEKKMEKEEWRWFHIDAVMLQEVEQAWGIAVKPSVTEQIQDEVRPEDWGETVQRVHIWRLDWQALFRDGKHKTQTGQPKTETLNVPSLS